MLEQHFHSNQFDQALELLKNGEKLPKKFRRFQEKSNFRQTLT